MMNRKHAFLLFTKAPKPGITKTRLTEARGGILTLEEAADLYQAMLLDVASIGFRALKELGGGDPSGDNGLVRYDFVISSPSEADQRKLEELFAQTGPWPLPITFINDRGSNFDEHFDDAFQQLFGQGYHSVVCVGGDLPTMPFGQIVQAFQWLTYFDCYSHQGGFVVAPCQECGVSLVGYTADTPMDSTGVYYNQDGIPALDAYVARAAEREIPIATLAPVADVDDTQDLAHMISVLRAMDYASQFQFDLFLAKRTLNWIDQSGIMVSTPPNAEHDPREYIDAVDAAQIQ